MASETHREDRCADAVARRRVRREIEAGVHFYARRLDLIESRLDELEGEWDVTRTLEVHAGLLALVGFVLGIFSKRWRLLPVVAAGFLLEHAFKGWCPPVSVYRALGIRTADEVTRERIALQAAAGDTDEKDADARAVKALRLAGLDEKA